MTTEKVDIVVVGAGPGGSAFALKAAKSGLSVVVLEKRQAVGEFIRCGEAIGWENLRKLGVKPDKRFCSQKSKSNAIISPSGKKFVYNPGGDNYIIERIAFDKELASIASSAGARILTRTRATGAKREGDKIIVSAKRLGKDMSFECRLLVAADGIESRTAKWFGIDTRADAGDIATCFQAEVVGADIKKPSIVEIWIGKVCPGGYVWVFPKGKDRANVGLGLPVSLAEKPAEEYLQAFFKLRGWDKASIVQDSCGLITLGLPLREFTADNLMIVGTAARQVGPMDGGGMGYAIRAGCLAAEVAIKAFKANDFSKGVLAEYDRRWQETEGAALRGALKLRRLVTELTDSEIDYFVENLSDFDLPALVKGRGIEKLVAAVMKKPSLMRLARHLI